MNETNKPAASGLSGVAIRRPIFITMIMVGLIVLGVFGFRRLPIDQFPQIDIPVVTVQTVYPGASSETIEREVTRRMEEAFNPIEGVDRMTSVSLEGVSQIVVEFELDRDVDVASQDIRSKIEAIRRDLPQDIEPPIVQKLDPAALPILSIGVSSDAMPLVQLTSLADETIRRRLESVSGVGEVRVAGGLEREVRVYLLPNRMQALSITIPDVMGALQRQNVELPAGRIEQGSGERLVRVAGRITDPLEFRNVILTNREGQPVRLGDVARVEEGTEEERSVALVNGQRAVALDILKVSGGNTVAVAEEVKQALRELERTLPSGVRLQIVRDNSVIIRQSVEDVIKELLIGALLTVIIVMLFLNDWKATAITSFALPVSVISAFTLMSALGFTLNVITLMALSLSIGILIDDAIVVIENIVRHREAGEDHFTAAGHGTRELFLAVMTTTFVVVAVFVPVAFMGGIIGRFFYQFGLTVAWAVLVSLFVSFTLTPMLAAWWGVNPHTGHGGNAVTRTIGRFNDWFDRQAQRYRGVITWALGHRKLTLAMAAGSFTGAVLLFPFIGGSFMPEADNSEFIVTFETPEGSSLAYTRAKAQQLIAVVRGIEGANYTYTTIGAGATGTVTNGEMFVKLVPSSQRDRSQREVMMVARAQLAPVFGVNTAVLEGGPGLGGARAPLQVEIRGPNVEELQQLSVLVRKEVEGIAGIVDVQSSLGELRPEYRITVNRDAANEVGVDVAQVGATVRPILAGQTATRWEDPTGEERDVVVQVAPEQRGSVEDIMSIPIATSTKRNDVAMLVPVRDVARIELGSAPAQIDRKDLQRVATIAASTSPELSISEASALIRERLTRVPMPQGYVVQLGGETEQLEETAGFVIEAIVLAVILIFLILASQFESLTQPFAIMVSLPLSLVGVLLALLITNNTLNIMSMIGVILLLGLVTKNAILLVDNANERRALGADRFAALVDAGSVRLRPIIMTTLAMIFGMLPIALALGEGGGFRAPMARSVIGGLITSTMLTLIVVPVAYTYFDDFGTWLKHRVIPPDREMEITKEQEVAGLAPEPAWGN
ncbi:MAG: efflux RND transporter permease subunit [Vicinamibacterales bacterium]|nr:efflux RND transporter permease subunit [Vicinamibacterales bacterium]